MVWGLLSQPARGERTKGVIDALKEAGLTVDYIEIDAATNADPVAGAPTFAGYVSSHPDVKLVVTDHGGLTATAETYLKAAGKKPARSPSPGSTSPPRPLRPSRADGPDWSSTSRSGSRATCPSSRSASPRSTGSPGCTSTPGAGFVDKSNVDLVAPLAEKNIR